MLTKKEFVTRSKKEHKNKYGYSHVIYKGTFVKVEIECPIHGIFEQVPVNHMRGIGCKKCGVERRTLTHEMFLQKANNKHGGKYGYSKTKYTGSRNIVEIICPKHGSFFQTAQSHLKGSGCDACNSPIGEVTIEIFLNDEKFEFDSPGRFKSCVNPKTNHRLRFDFYVKKYNLCIEFDGVQHFRPTKWFGNMTKDEMDEAFKDYMFRDSIKNKFCSDNKINLLRIHYKDLKNIKKLVLEAIAKIEASETGYVANLYQY